MKRLFSGWYVILAITANTYSSCSKSSNAGNTIKNPDTTAKTEPSGSSLPAAPPANGAPVTVTIGNNANGYLIPAGFEGFSYETNNIAKAPTYLRADNTVMIQMIQNLGPNGIIRIGGNSSDQTTWTGQPRNANTGTGYLTTTDVDQLTAFVSALNGWKLIFGLNMANYDPSLAANEAVYVSNAAGNNLYALQFGNEPSSYAGNGLRPAPYDVNAYMADWKVYRDSVRNVLPQAPLAGPDISRVTHQTTAFLKTFADNLHSDINLLTGHYYGNDYSTTSSTDPETVFDSITSVLTYNTTPARLTAINTLATSYNIPYRITETGSVASGGVAGLSDAFGSALWALDFMWQVAINGGQGVNFHGSATSAYTPIGRANGAIVPRPGYYAMLAFKYAGTAGGRVQPATLTANGKLCTAYACANGGSTYVTLVNRDTSNLSYTVNLPVIATSMSISRLTAASIAATTGITFANATINADGTFTPASTEQYAVSGTSAIVNVPARTAVVVTFE